MLITTTPNAKTILEPSAAKATTRFRVGDMVFPTALLTLFSIWHSYQTLLLEACIALTLLCRRLYILQPVYLLIVHIFHRA